MKPSNSSWNTPQSIIDYYSPYQNNALRDGKKLSSEFEIEDTYEIIEMVGRGAYGVVVAASDKKTRAMVAIKKIQKAFEHKIFAKRTLRELKILRLLNHDNILKVTNIVLPISRQQFNDIYLMTPLVEGDLYSIIKSPQKMEEDHVKFIIYQILRACKYFHSAKVLHRDLKPRNILISAKCEVTICDFGLARVMFENETSKIADNMTDYVATRWYRAPELLLGNEKYDEKIDVWSVGCILAEMYLRKPFLMGTDWKNQLFLILDLLGSPRPEELDFVENAKAKEFLKNYGSKGENKIQSFFEESIPNPHGIDLLYKMLVFNPKHRISVDEALSHPYLSELYCPEDEPTTKPLSPLEFDFENLPLNKEQMKDLIYEEILLYHFPNFREKHVSLLNSGVGTSKHVLNNDNKDYIQFEKEDDERVQ
jgi:serine/threonine protein kinase